MGSSDALEPARLEIRAGFSAILARLERLDKEKLKARLGSIRKYFWISPYPEHI